MNPGRTALILMVDDTPANLSVLSDLLSARGFKISVAEDGESALEQLQYVKPDLILLDVLMPHLDGFTTCRRLKERPETKEIPVIFMTALTDTVEKVKGFELGAVDYITKPFQQEEVLARVSTHLALQQLRARLQESEARLERIIDSAMDAIIAVDEAGHILLFNRAAERVFRCQAEEAIGGSCQRFLSQALGRVLREYMSEASPKTPIWVPKGYAARRADGETFPVEATFSRAETDGRALYTVFLRDVEEHQRLHGLNLYLQEELRGSQPEGDLIGASGGLRAVMKTVRQIAATEASVLLLGETGTGKEVIARAIHASSPRKDQALITLNCAALPKDLVESELFGHEKGAFTGALARRLGRFELAHKGTLFLDEIGELPLDLQAKLLRVLQEGEFERVGGTETRKIDVRILAATNRDLARCARDGSFRADLYYRLNVFPITLPPLRQRKEDLPLLVQHFVRRYAEKYAKSIAAIPAHALKALEAHDWPGNVRELQHVIERAVILTRGTELALDAGMLNGAPGGPPGPLPIETLKAAERAHILKALEACGWRVSGKGGAAELLGLRSSTLDFRIKKLGINRPA